MRRPLARKPTNMNTSTVAKKETVRAAINEKKFFELQGQLYKSSFSFLGELMQNARRAGSTAVWFHLDKDKAQLICRDDGCGVEEFQNLVQLATSGWTDEKVQLTDKPFGMGLFSLFYACESVTVRSRGKMLVITRDDVIQRREIEVRADKDKVVKGTVIIMDGLNAKLIEDTRYFTADTSELFKIELSCELRDRALGFEIPVHLNEVTLDRPFARCNLKGEASKIGWVSIRGIHEGDTLSSTPCDHVGYFLQGLPIGAAPKYMNRSWTVVHLDSEQFVPVMPDRAVLQDESAQLKKVESCIMEITQRFLCEQKQALPAAEFVCKYFDHIQKANLAYILNDVPVIPASKLFVVSEIHYSTSETWTLPHRSNSAVISRQDILDGHVKLWRYAPNNAVDSEFAVALLKVMERNSIHTLSSEDEFDKGHWIHQCTPDASEFMVEVTPGKELSRGDMVDSGRADSCELRMVEDFTLRITSRVAPDFIHVELVNNDWVLVPEVPSEDQDGEADGDLICYFTATDDSRSSPWRALSDFEDENDQYREDWEGSTAADWNATIAAIKGQPLANTIATALHKATECPDRRQANQFAIVRAVARWNNWNGTSSHMFRTVTPNAEFFASLAMELKNNPDGSMAERLQAAFAAVVRPGELDLDESVESNLVDAAGYRVLTGAIKNSWYVLLPGEKVANFEAENHNYLGLFSSKEAAVADAFGAVLKQVEKVLGTTPEAFAELDFPAQWKQVKAAFEKTGE